MKDLNKVENIILVSLADKFCKGVGVLLSESLDMYNADAKDMVVYDLINPKEALEKCGIEYLKKRERGVVASVSEFTGTVISMNFDLFKDNYDLFKNSLVCYLALPLKLTEGAVNEIDFSYRDGFLKQHSDKIVVLENKIKKGATKTIINMLKGE